MMWSMIPCRPAMTFWSIVGHASFHTAGTMGPSMSERSYLEALMVSVAMKRRFAASLLHQFCGMMVRGSEVTCADEYELTTLPGGCKLFFVGAFTVAYYQTPGKASDVKWG